MLQQTTTAAVDSYYRRFIKRFPDVKTLAEAELTEVQRYWEGLGYYRRVKQLHQASIVIVNEHNDIFPDTFDAVLALPGIGRYTAGAICSIAQNQRYPILEANTIRLHARLLGYSDDPAKSFGNKLLWKMAEKILPETRPGHFNQALMDLGSLVCTPKTPKCSICPVFILCQAACRGTQNQIPALNKGKTFEERTEVALVVEKNKKYLMIQYPESVRWGGLWDFPRHVADSSEKLIVNQKLLEDFKRITGYSCSIQKQIMTIRHAVTKFKIKLCVCQAELTGQKTVSEYRTYWMSKKELAEIPLNTTARKIVNSILCEHHSDIQS